MPLRVALVHHHLQPGGVTRVLGLEAAGLAAQGVQVAVLAAAGGLADSLPPQVACRHVEGLDYLERTTACPAVDLAERLRQTAQAALGAAPDVWHIHNHSLGKNPALTSAVHQLARAGHKLLLHLHDFAEDFRPALYRRLLEHISTPDEILYPQGAHVQYAVLNKRDLAALLAAGLPPTQASLLPNPIEPPPAADAPARQENAYVYPTRAIRRKNLGEFLFWAAVAGNETRFDVTLAPQNPAERPAYDAWVEFARHQHLPVRFAVGAQAPGGPAALMRAARGVFTTSVAEGFGLAFLEPWLAGCPVLGRDLPPITEVFKDAGINLDRLYPRLEVPLAWVDEGALRGALDAGLDAIWKAYGLERQAGDLECAWAACVKHAHVDFGRLNEELQRAVILQVLRLPPAARQHLWEPVQSGLPAPAVIQQNARLVCERFSVALHAQRLLAVYEKLAGCSAGPLGTMDAARLRQSFIRPENLFLLRGS